MNTSVDTFFIKVEMSFTTVTAMVTRQVEEKTELKQSREPKPPSDLPATRSIHLESLHDCVSFFKLPFTLAESTGGAREDVFVAPRKVLRYPKSTD